METSIHSKHTTSCIMDRTDQNHPKSFGNFNNICEMIYSTYGLHFILNWGGGGEVLGNGIKSQVNEIRSQM
jgi:hypothetical protein